MDYTTSFINGFESGIDASKLIYLALLEKIEDIVLFLFTAYPSALHLTILIVCLLAIVYIPIRSVSKW